MYSTLDVTKSANFHTWFKTISSPTVIEHAVYANFISSSKKSLITAGGTHIEVYDFSENVDPVSNPLPGDHSATTKKLQHVLAIDLYEKVESLCATRFAGDKRHSILCSFSDSKVALLQYDPANREIKTVSLHNYDYEFLKEGRIQFTRPPLLRVDHENRCAVVLIYDRHLAVLPFRRDPSLISGGGSSLPFTSHLSDNPSFSEGTSSVNKVPPILSSYLITLTDIADEKLNNIIDMQFLFGYYEPTLLILFEPIGTWSGRVSARQDTCAIAALSLNLQNKSSPVIWSLQNLPYDSMQLLPVEKPIGGVIVLAANSFIYLNQSQPPCGVALNSYVEGSTSFPMKKSTCAPISLDCCRALFIKNDQIALGLKSGELFVVTLLINQTMRTVTGIHYVQVTETVYPQAMALCDDGFIFVGSKFTDSVLLHCLELDAEMDTFVKIYANDDDKGPKSQSDQEGNNYDDLDMEMYGEDISSEQDVKRVINYSIIEHDRLDCIGPISRLTCGEVSNGSSEFVLSHQSDSNVEMVAVCGTGKFGCLSVLHRSLRPVLRKTFELPGSTDVWAFRGPSPRATSNNDVPERLEGDQSDCPIDVDASSPSDHRSSSDNPACHRYFLIAREDSTMVLEVGQDIAELEVSGFCTEESTVFATNIGDCYLRESKREYPHILQVCPNAIRLLYGATLIETVRLDSEWAVKQCSFADPFILMCNEEEEFFLVRLNQVDESDTQSNSDDDCSPKLLTITKPKTVGLSSVPVCFCLFHDKTDFLSNHLIRMRSRVEEISAHHRDENIQMRTEKEQAIPAIFTATYQMDAEDEDILLYGESVDYVKSERAYSTAYTITPDMPEDNSHGGQSEEVDDKSCRHWAFLVFSNGTLQIYSIPEFKLYFEVEDFSNFFTVLVDHRLHHSQASTDPIYKDDDDIFPPIKEVFVDSFGADKSRLILLARTSNELILYEAYSFSTSIGECPSSLLTAPADTELRWHRLPQTVLLRAPRRIRQDIDYESLESLEGPHCLRSFSCIRNSSNGRVTEGVFVCGRHPVMLACSSAGHLRAFPMYIDGVVPGFTPFHIEENQHGFAYFNHSGELRIANLPPGIRYDTELAVRKIHLNGSIHFIQYHITSKTYVVICSRASLCCSVFKLNAEGDKQMDVMERDERCILPLLHKYSMEIYSPLDDWAEATAARIEFEEWESVAAMSTVKLTSQETHSGLKDFIAIGSNLSYGEEIPVRGKIILLDIVQVVPEPGQPLTRHKVKMLYNEEQKGPVTAISSCEGFLVAAIGQKIYIWTMKDNDLVGVAFVDSEVYVHEIQSLKNMILVSDVLKSIQLLRFQSGMRVLSLVSKDNRPRQVFASNFFVDNKNLGFLVIDQENNLMIYCYDPIDKESKNGRRLLRRVDMRLPNRVVSTLRIRNRLRDPALMDRPHNVNDPDLARHSLYMGSCDGAIYRLSPIRDKLLSRLRIIEKNLIQTTSHHAGLHPKASRQYRFSEPELVNPCGNVADGDLLWRYMNLPHNIRVEIAKKAGQSLESIMDDITDLQATTQHF